MDADTPAVRSVLTLTRLLSYQAAGLPAPPWLALGLPPRCVRPCAQHKVEVDDCAQQRGEEAPHRDEPGRIEEVGRGKGQQRQNTEDLHHSVRGQNRAEGGRHQVQRHRRRGKEMRRDVLDVLADRPRDDRKGDQDVQQVRAHRDAGRDEHEQRSPAPPRRFHQQHGHGHVDRPQHMGEEGIHMGHHRVELRRLVAEGQPDHAFAQLLDREQQRDRGERQFARATRRLQRQRAEPEQDGPRREARRGREAHSVHAMKRPSRAA